MLNVPCHGVLLKEVVGLLEKSATESLREIYKKKLNSFPWLYYQRCHSLLVCLESIVDAGVDEGRNRGWGGHLKV